LAAAELPLSQIDRILNLARGLAQHRRQPCSRERRSSALALAAFVECVDFN
jgi:hypothetical protein